MSWGRWTFAGLSLAALSGPTSACEIRGDILTSAGGLAGADPGTGGLTASGGEGPLTGGNGGGTGREFIGATNSLSAGDYQSCFVAEGDLFCFGRGAEGALGTGSLTDRVIPTPAQGANGITVVRTGGYVSCALRSSGVVLCTGRGRYGSNGSFSDRSTFEAVDLPLAARWLTVGEEHVCAGLSDGRMVCWGKNAEGQLGQPDPFPEEGPPSAVPLEVALEDVRDASAGQGHTCAITETGALYCWGRNSEGELGLGAAAPAQLRSPQRVGTDADWRQVRAGQGHTCASKADGSFWCWGSNASGQLGTSDRMPRDLPTRVLARVDDFDLDTFHTCVLAAGAVSCSGRGIEGALGTGTNDQLEFVVSPSSQGALEVAVGRFHTCLRTPTQVLCTGQNDEGRLGVGDLARRSSFTPVLAP